MNRRVHLTISGDVQGVSFRSYARQEALRLGVSGWVRNTPDGSVEIVAEGEEALLGKLIALCRQGPRHAAVAHVAIAWEPFTGAFSGFSIKY